VGRRVPQHHSHADSQCDKETTKTKDEALIELYRRLRPGDPPTKDNAATLLDNLFFNERRYDLARVGRYKLNLRLHPDDRGTDRQLAERILTEHDLVEIIRTMIRLNHGIGEADDIDHLGNRRIRAAGELIQMHVGLVPAPRSAASGSDDHPGPETVTPQGLISTTRPVMAAVREFFGGSQLLQFMDQTNPLAELTHKRRLSALGPGGLSRDRAGFDVETSTRRTTADLPDRDPRGAEHRPDRLAGDVRQDQPVRLHRDAVPTGDLDAPAWTRRRSTRSARSCARTRRRPRARWSRRPARS
jgi:DNA-directed RNA polymerase subunit beta